MLIFLFVEWMKEFFLFEWMKDILLVGFIIVWIYGGVVAMMGGCAGFGGDVAGMVVVFL